MEDKELKHQRLDSISKIMAATGAINYMAVAIDSVNEQIKCVPDKEGYHKAGIEDRDATLIEVSIKLGEIMNLLGDCIDRTGGCCSIDTYLTTPAFRVIVHGEDDVEGDFDTQTTYPI